MLQNKHTQTQVNQKQEPWKCLPENSNGFNADNPEIFVSWFKGKDVAPQEWPYIILCYEQTSNSYTWHMLCNERNIPRLINIGLKELIEDHIHNERKRDVVCTELICRCNTSHQFV